MFNSINLFFVIYSTKKDENNRDIWAFGGDLGYVGVVNDSNFCANGLVSADRSLHPHIFEVKKVMQYIHFEPVIFSKNQIRVTNRHDFISLDKYCLQWAIECDGQAVQKGNMNFPHIPAGETAVLTLPIQALATNAKEHFLTLRAFTKEATPLVPQGHEVAIEQWQLPITETVQKIVPVQGNLTINQDEENLSLNGRNFKISFSKANGQITQLNYHGKDRIKEGLQPNFWRPMTDNDIPTNHRERCATWEHAGKNAKLQTLDVNEEHEFTTIKAIYLMEEQESQLEMTYQIRADGIIQVTMHFIPGTKALCEIPRLGMYMILPAEYEMMTWLGRGPHENYEDRKTSALIGQYQATVWEQYHPYVRAQETANHCDVRWVALRNTQGEGLLITGKQPLSVSAWNFPMNDIKYRPSQVERRHGGSIHKKDMVWLNIDHKQMGVGGDNTWGAQVHSEYTITPHEWEYTFTIQPLHTGENAADKAHHRHF